MECRWRKQRTQVLRVFIGRQEVFRDNCGTPVGFQAEHYEGEIALSAANLAEPAEFQPQFNVHHQSNLSWLAIDDNLQ